MEIIGRHLVNVGYMCKKGRAQSSPAALSVYVCSCVCFACDGESHIQLPPATRDSVSVAFHQYCRRLPTQAGHPHPVIDNLVREGYHIVFTLAQTAANNTPVGSLKLSKPETVHSIDSR